MCVRGKCLHVRRVVSSLPMYILVGVHRIIKDIGLVRFIRAIRVIRVVRIIRSIRVMRVVSVVCILAVLLEVQAIGIISTILVSDIPSAG